MDTSKSSQMKALVIGQGGREHAIVRALRLSPSVTEVHALPWSDGIAKEAHCHDIDWKSFDAVEALIQNEKITLVVIGPEAPIEAGLPDRLRAKGISVFAPSTDAGRLESSKIYSKRFMQEAGVPTARAEVVLSVASLKAAAAKFQPPYVLKADGLAAGKGVFICKTESELLDAGRSIFEDGSLGDAGREALLEEFNLGYEVSYLVLTDGENFEPFVLAQDHKRIGDGDTGPNTGGMGVVAPVSISQSLREEIDRTIVAPTIAHIRKSKLVYRGVLYIGLMITPDGPSVLEFNTRFGDPEAQVVIPLLDGDWGQVFQSVAQGKLPKLHWKKSAACCVVMAAENYPDTPVKGAAITGVSPNAAADDGASAKKYVLHAGTKLDQSGRWTTNGGRVLNVMGLGETLREAVDNAYAKASEIEWPGMQMRKDIGARLL
jgi:phosphoribosylamine--glycine ligase